MTKIIFARHGETEDNVIHKLSTSVPGPCLTSLGREQAKALSADLNKYSIDVIYSSDLQRAIETALIVNESRGVPIIKEERFREYSFGVYEGRTYGDVVHEIERMWDAWCVEEALEYKLAEEAESADMILKRSLPALKNILDSEQERTILVVAHSGVLQLLLGYICENIPFKYGHNNWLRNCETVEVNYIDGHYICERWAGNLL